jgi:hypothetical protein
MKANSSRYILVAEIITIILFHAVKIKQAEKHPAEMVFARDAKSINLHQPSVETKSGIHYLLVNMAK